MVIAQETCSGDIGQDYAKLVDGLPLLVGDDQKFESAAQAVAVTDNGSQLQEVRSEWDRKLQGNDLAVLQLAAEGRPDAVEAEFAGSAPVYGRLAFAKHRHFNARVKTIAGEAPQPALKFGGRLCVDAQSSFPILDLPCALQFAIVLEGEAVLNGIKVHVPKITRPAAWG